MSQKHNVFISFHSADIAYKNEFERLFHSTFEVLVSRSVQENDISNNIATETVRQKIRDEYLRDSTVTVVLIGANTWQRKHVDWEISSSIRNTAFNSRSGLVGIILPTYPLYSQNKYNPYTIPPRLYSNLVNNYAKIYNWSNDPDTVQKWIHDAFLNRKLIIPDNSYPSFVNNRSGDKWQ
ncbi:MAG: TIR domain-containing protein [Chitinophagaceae bacterium]|nr:TIR domain-containing protein [Chitinophagaceae bacterium]